MKSQEATELLAEANNEVNDIYDALVVNKENNKVPEYIFKDYFLPYFAGTAKQEDKDILAQWIAIAGTPTSEVDVVNSSNEKLFTVPSIFDTSIINLNKLNNTSINGIMSQYELENNNVPKIARDNLKSNLHNKFSELVSASPNIINKKEVWNNILVKYGYVNENKSIKPIDNNGDDDLLYD